ncbi:formate hydrogenlyase [Alicyclobacillaceae bacterium I2511]|nr:formate hydrogenlyase [Alicyclobacillaceae bacterium I2511]
MLWGAQIVGVVLAIGLAPFFMGVAQTVKARRQGRHGPSVWQGYWVLAKTWRKETTVPEYSSWVFRLAPSMSLAALLLTVLLIPWSGTVPSAWPHDLLAVFFLLAFERFWVGLAGMDSAGTFGGLGASRIATLGTGIEPAMLAAFGVLWVLSRQTAIQPLAPALMRQSLGIIPWGLAVLSYAFVLLAETGRLPVDNPDTHLELTMMHEATVLEYNGRFLAQSQLAIAVKLTAILGLGWIWLGPQLATPWANLGLRLVELLVSSVALGWLESRSTKLRYFQLSTYLTMAAGIGILAFYLVSSGGLN